MATTNECKRCGWCCTHVILKIDQPFDKVSRTWLAARGIQIEKGFLVIPSRCPHYGRGVIASPGVVGKQSHCDIYTQRPTLCAIQGCPQIAPEGRFDRSWP